ncbi:hypothetical protein IWW50_001105 [Coemansia erecta]|nr:hypothetical protein GGF43_004706 [Coemansia sp. RSA 2618]KAJ2828975.1 hypothetical protein IWW50_001105 [Coemansia erecta]
MRAGRRRLSASVVGSGNSVLSSSPRSSTGGVGRHGLTRGAAASKDHGMRKPGLLERRTSARSVGPGEGDTLLGEAMRPASSSLPASPELAFGQHWSSPTVTSAPDRHFDEQACDGMGPYAGVAAASPSCEDTSTDCGGSEDEWATPDEELQFAMDSEDDGELLPTPRQLIETQTWSTWPTPCHDLYSGSRFSGTQSNGARSYIVTVLLKYVDMGVPELCGHFTICGLTNDLPKLTTYFDAQVVGTDKYSFITNQWDASIDTDRTHWGFFPAFRPYRNRFDGRDFAYRLKMSDRFVFMRWKERFVVPNYKLSRINGASFDGFYYVCYDRVEGTITGYYYHKDSDQYQCLKLSHTRQTSFSHFELA